ncbi:MAG: helix-turn-helix transcriptional regulator [Proteobacteria bacterium]|nr:helix-turn-helix transcriptional regulator [Pseudomonadota bacterium]
MNREDAEKLSQRVVEILEQERIKRKITKLRISKETGISRTAITLLVKKQNSPTLRTLMMVASAVGIDLKEVIRRAETDIKS